MSNDWTDPALCHFLSDYVVEANEVKVSPGYLNHLQKLYVEGSDDIIAHAISAVSLASFSNQFRSEDLLTRSRESYSKALLLVKRALSNPQQITKDGTLAGVFFLNMYEVWIILRHVVEAQYSLNALFQMIGVDKPILSQWGTHADAHSILL